MYERGELLKTACGSPCYASPEVTILTHPIDDCWKEVLRTIDRYMEFRGHFVCNGVRIPSF